MIRLQKLPPWLKNIAEGKPTAKPRKDTLTIKRGSCASKAEELFALQVKAHELPEPVRELRFATSIGRGWRFDFAWPDFHVAVEIEGLVCEYIRGVPYAVGRHATFKGFEEDCRKYAAAASLGWYVIRFNQELVKNSTAIDATIHLLNSKGWTSK